MKKFLLILVALLIILGILGAIGWTRRSSIAAELISRSLNGVPTTIGSLDVFSGGATIDRLKIGNPVGFRSPSAFTAQTIGVTATLPELRGNPLTIERIDMQNLLVTVESKKDGSTNWDKMTASNKKPSNRHYLIKTLTLTNLTVQAVKADGSIKTYPTIPQMTFYNISDETGFPVSEIEKAIFNLMMKNLFQQLDLKNQLLPLIPGGNSILPFMP